MPQSFASLHCHIVFSTKYRAQFITPEIQTRLYPYLGGIGREQGYSLIAAGGMPDHVHLLVSMSREVSVAGVVRVLKANSSKWIHETFPDMAMFAWQAGYGAFAVSYLNIGAVQKYLANQAVHHRRQTFQEEFVALLRKHDIEYDERYLWE